MITPFSPNEVAVLKMEWAQDERLSKATITIDIDCGGLWFSTDHLGRTKKSIEKALTEECFFDGEFQVNVESAQ
jgi:hypothetical protein